MNNADEFKKEIAIFLTHQLNDRIERARKALAEVRSRYEEAIKELTQTTVTLCEREDDLARVRKNMKTAKDFEEEFEKILELEGVRRVYVDDFRIAVETKRIFLVICGLTGETSYDIGQPIMNIYPMNDKVQATDNINFTPGEYKGTHVHPDATSMPCFGNDLNYGLNLDMTALLRGLHMVPLVNLLLSFLRRDERYNVLSRRTLAELQTLPEYGPQFETGYGSPEEKEKHKTAYVKLLTRAAEKMNTEGIAKIIAELQVKFDKDVQSWVDLQTQLRLAEEKIPELENYRGQTEKKAGEEAEVLARYVAGIQLDNRGLIIHFSFDKLDLRLRLDPHQPAKVFGIPQYHVLASAVDDRCRLTADKEAQKKLFKLAQDGKISDLVAEVCEVLEKKQRGNRNLNFEGGP